MAFTAIPNSIIAADSSLNTTLFTYFRDNDDYLKALFNISTGHNHGGGTDSGAPVSVPDGSITALKLGAGSATNPKIAGGVFSFKMPETLVSATTYTFCGRFWLFCPSGVTNVRIRFRALAVNNNDDLFLKIAMPNGTGAEYYERLYPGFGIFKNIEYAIAPAPLDKDQLTIYDIIAHTSPLMSFKIHHDYNANDTVSGVVVDYTCASYFN